MCSDEDCEVVLVPVAGAGAALAGRGGGEVLVREVIKAVLESLLS